MKEAVYTRRKGSGLREGRPRALEALGCLHPRRPRGASVWWAFLPCGSSRTMRSLSINSLPPKATSHLVSFLCNQDRSLPEASGCYQRDLGCPPPAISKAHLLTLVVVKFFSGANQGERATHAQKTQTP